MNHEPHVISQSWVMPGVIQAMGVTNTRSGITTKQVLCKIFFFQSAKREENILYYDYDFEFEFFQPSFPPPPPPPPDVLSTRPIPSYPYLVTSRIRIQSNLWN